ncbi:hypothetical protein Q1695_012408 [Nippostrongylus brasiliensis]|nr:hypothetical protein Q1695_012408 [Nippostrongylus brasiliensis]
MNAIRLSDGRCPSVGIQAAFGTGKTVLRGLYQSRAAALCLGHSAQGRRTSNSVRYLKRLHIEFAAQLTPAELELYSQFARGRALLERALFDPDSTLNLSEDQREEFRIAEKEIPKITSEVVTLMFNVRNPSTVCLTTAALLNATDKDGMFHSVSPQYKTIIGDEASQIPEPALVAMATRLCHARHVYIEDIYQLEQHVRCPRTSLAARLGARVVMDILVEKRIPIASLTTTFTCHPFLMALRISCPTNTSCRAIVVRLDRRLLLDNSNCPNSNLPFVFINVNGCSRPPNGSHFSTADARACRDIITMLLSTAITPASMANVDLYTVDVVQGR